MSVRMSILAMLAAQPSYGYLLRAEFDRRTGSGTPLNVGQVYKALELLERDGYATRSAHTDDDGHVFYEATAEGSAAVSRWLATPETGSGGGRSDLATKVAIACSVPGIAIEPILETQRASARARRSQLDAETIPTSGGIGPQLVADATTFDLEAELRWLDQVEARVRAARESGEPLHVPFDLDPPRRGRPAKV
ncbi:transcriptional regulator [Salinibacterium hongtaonis]|nr:transcriptional regulator [Salinibacterium hongtaonis]